MNQAQARTTSRDPKYRLLLVGLALAMINLWITLCWSRLVVPRRGSRWFKDDLFTLSRFLDFIAEAARSIYGFVNVVRCPASASLSA